MKVQTLLSEAVIACKNLSGRYFAGFDATNHVRQAVNLPNHFAWNLGHCALTMHRVGAMFDGGGIPSDDFGPGGFDPESVAFGSTPAGDGAKYPPPQRCIEVFNRACERLGAAVAGATDEKLDERVKWGPVETTLAALTVRMVFHNGMHTGQIADLRRALGFKSIFA